MNEAKEGNPRLYKKYDLDVPVFSRAPILFLYLSLSISARIFGALAFSGERLLACTSPADLASLLLALPVAAGAELFAELARRTGLRNRNGDGDGDSSIHGSVGESGARSSARSGNNGGAGGDGGAVAVLGCAVGTDPSRAGALVAEVPPAGRRGAPLRAALLLSALASANASPTVPSNSLAAGPAAAAAGAVARHAALVAFLPAADRAAFAALCAPDAFTAAAAATAGAAGPGGSGGSGVGGGGGSPTEQSAAEPAAAWVAAQSGGLAQAAAAAREAAAAAVAALLAAGGGLVCGSDGAWRRLARPASTRPAAASGGPASPAALAAADGAAAAAVAVAVAVAVRAQHVLAPGNRSCPPVVVAGAVVAWRFKVVAEPARDATTDEVADNGDGNEEVAVPVEWVPTRTQPRRCRDETRSSSGDGESGDDSGDGSDGSGDGSDDDDDGEAPSLDGLFDDDDDDDDGVDGRGKFEIDHRRGQSPRKTSLELEGCRDDGRDGLDAVISH